MSCNKVGHENSAGNHSDAACFLWSIFSVRNTCSGRKEEKKEKKEKTYYMTEMSGLPSTQQNK